MKQHFTRTEMSYWSVYRQQWVGVARGSGIAAIPDQELAAMNEDQREKLELWFSTNAEWR